MTSVLICTALAAVAVVTGCGEAPPAAREPAPKPIPTETMLDAVTAPFGRVPPGSLEAAARAERLATPVTSEDVDPADRPNARRGTAEDELSLLPARTEEMPHVRIGWWVNDALGAYREAMKLKKVLVLVLGEPWCEWCERQLSDSLRCPSIDRFAGDAVFGYSFVSSDDSAKTLADALEIVQYPAMSVLEPHPRALIERARFVGFMDPFRLGGLLQTALWETPPHSDPTFAGAARLEGEPGSPSTALLLAGRAGLTHRPPAPTCPLIPAPRR